MKTYLFNITLAGVSAILILASFHYKGGGDAMVAQVESQITAISFKKAVLIKKIYVSPGQVVQKGDTLIKVERPDLALDLDKKMSERNEIKRRIEEAQLNYKHSLIILETDHNRKISQLMANKEELKYDLQLSREREKRINGISPLNVSVNDTLKINDLKLTNELLNSYDYQLKIQKQQLFKNLKYNVSNLNSNLKIIDKEIKELEDENNQLVQVAQKSGTIGNLFVQLNELVQPYTTLLSLYDLNPNLIKAFINEQGAENIHIGSAVRVESVHKKYSIVGQIVEIGYRITSYPDKINPTIKQKSYGQEIFINIPKDNKFLNGEKVYVHVIN